MRAIGIILAAIAVIVLLYGFLDGCQPTIGDCTYRSGAVYCDE